MSEPTADQQPLTPPEPTPPNPESPADADSTTVDAPGTEQPAESSSLGDTAGTGTIIALGCITGTIFLIILGLLYLLITQVFG